MTFWIVAGALGIGAALLIWLAVLRAGQADVQSSAAYDLEIYRDQLRELDRDTERGVIGGAEADRARAEVSRRLLDADRRMQAEEEAQSGSALPLAIGLVVTIGLSVYIYTSIGAPGYPDLPLAERVAEIETARAARPGQDAAELDAPAFPPVELTAEESAEINALRARMERETGDIEGWIELAQVEASLRNYIAARRAQERAIALLGEEADARLWVNLARMQILAAGGYVSPEAEAALRAALDLDPRQGDARFLLGAMYQRQGRPDLTLPLWLALLEESRPDAPWVQPILGQIETVAFFAGQPVDMDALVRSISGPADGATGPTRQQMEAASEMSPEDRLAMIENMVASLNDRLANEGGPAEDWARLIGAYGVLGRLDAARSILAEARTAFDGDARAQALFDEVETTLPVVAE